MRNVAIKRHRELLSPTVGESLPSDLAEDFFASASACNAKQVGVVAVNGSLGDLQNSRLVI